MRRRPSYSREIAMSRSLTLRGAAVRNERGRVAVRAEPEVHQVETLGKVAS